MQYHCMRIELATDLLMGSEVIRPQVAREHQVAHVLTSGDSNIVSTHSKRQLVRWLIKNAPWRPRGHFLASMHEQQWKHDKQPARGTLD